MDVEKLFKILAIMCLFCVAIVGLVLYYFFGILGLVFIELLVLLIICMLIIESYFRLQHNLDLSRKLLRIQSKDSRESLENIEKKITEINATLMRNEMIQDGIIDAFEQVLDSLKIIKDKK